MRNRYGEFVVNPANAPLKRPGIYRVTHLISGKTYIGISKDLAGRARQHLYPKGSSKLANAIRLHGPSGFMFEPLFYCLPGQFDISFLSELEAEKIVENNSIRYGYNIIEACGRVGPYGPEFSKTIVASHARRTPEERSAIAIRAKAAMSTDQLSDIGRRNAMAQPFEVRSERCRTMRLKQTPERRKEIGQMGGKASAEAAVNNPELMALRHLNGKILAAAHNSPEIQRQRYLQGVGIGGMSSEALSTAGSKGALIANANRTPEERKKLAQKAAQIRLTNTSPEERRARAKKAGKLGAEACAKRSLEDRKASAQKTADTRRENGSYATPTKGSRWINDGQHHRRLRDGDNLPDGWSYGHLGNTSRANNKDDSNLAQRSSIFESPTKTSFPHLPELTKAT